MTARMRVFCDHPGISMTNQDIRIGAIGRIIAGQRDVGGYITIVDDT